MHSYVSPFFATLGFQRHLRLRRLVVVAAMLLGAPATALSQCEPFGWSTFGDVIPSPGPETGVFAMTTFDDGRGTALYVAGTFTSAGGVPAANIAKWDGTTWSALGAGLLGTVRALCVFDDGLGNGPALYAAGSFPSGRGSPAPALMRWDGDAWSSVPGTFSAGASVAYAMTVFNDGSGPALFVGGWFPELAGQMMNHVARWDGRNWSPLGGGVVGTVQSLLGFGGSLYVGGNFTSAGTVTTKGVARWHDSQWHALGTGFTSNGNAYTLAAFDNGSGPMLYVGGDFFIQGATVQQNIFDLAWWDGFAWHAQPSPAGTYSIRAMAVQTFGESQALYVVGQRDNLSTCRAARIDGTGFHVLTMEAGVAGLEAVARAAAIWTDSFGETYLHMGGVFSRAGPLPAGNIARWNARMPATDCNNNMFADDCDFLSDYSQDCDTSGTPDECDAQWTYALDPPNLGAVWGPSGGGDILWLTRFNVRPAGEIITHLSVANSCYLPDDWPMRVMLYSDPNGDGNPNDAQLLRSAVLSSFCTNAGGGKQYVRVPVPPTYVGPIGASFFVGAHATTLSGMSAAEAAGGNDSSQRNWQRLGTAGAIDVGNINSGGSPVIVPRAWRLRALSLDCNGNGVWDSCDIDAGTSLDLDEDGLPDECEPPCPADIASPPNGQVNTDDLILLIGSWGNCSVCTPANCPADIAPPEGNCVVNTDDLILLIGSWGSCP